MNLEVIVTLAVGIPTAIVAVLAYWLTRTESRDKSHRQLIEDLLGPIREQLDDLEQELNTHPVERRQLVEDLLHPIKERLDQIDRDIRELRRYGPPRH